MLPPQIRFLQRGWLNSNHILILGEGGPVIVDTGCQADVVELIRLLRQARIDPATVRLIVNTHSHWDHCGGNGLLQKMSRAKVAMSAQTADLFARNDRWAMWLDYFNVESEPVTADETWEDGQEVILAGMPFVVIATPGHAPDAISLYQPQHRVLICADALMENDCGIINVAVHGEEALTQALATVERLAQLDAAVALPGHGNLITDVAHNLKLLRQRLQGFQAEPARLAGHLLKRVFMTHLMEMQPVDRDEFMDEVLTSRWLRDYAPRYGMKPEPLCEQIIGEFIERGSVHEEEGRLMSLVPR